MSFLRSSVLLVTLGLAGCGDDSAGSGGGGAGEPTTTTTSTTTSGSTTNSSGSTTSTSSTGTSMGMCNATSCDADEACVNCTQAFGPAHECVDDVPVGQGEFDCGWTVCDVGTEYCVVSLPIADGCEERACQALPPECGVGISCDCLEEAEPDGTCVQDQDGNLVVTKTA